MAEGGSAQVECGATFSDDEDPQTLLTIYGNPSDPTGLNMSAAKADGVWAGSVTFTLRAHWELGECEFLYEPRFLNASLCAYEGGDQLLPRQTGTMYVTYKGVTKEKTLNDLYQAGFSSDCPNINVYHYVTVFDSASQDGSYFHIT